jgi:ribosome-binding ATPase YchF (GTP1/OBG family)
MYISKKERVSVNNYDEYILHCCSALPKIIKTGFSAINLIYFFTAGPDEVIFLPE